MKNVAEMTIEELQTLIASAQDEIAKRDAAGNGFDKEFSTGSKAYRPCTYKQIQFAESLSSKTGSVIKPNNSQLMKYFEAEDMSEAIDLMKSGKRIKIS